jgi:hypothetical protein
MDISELFSALQEYAATNPNALRKDTSGFWNLPGGATTGINYYDLELGAKTLVPIITPLRNKIPRVSGKGGIQANWRAIVGLNVSSTNTAYNSAVAYNGPVGGAVADGNRNAYVQTQTRDFTAAYKQIGLEDYVSFGADLAAQGFDDLKALSVRNLLWATMIEEEWITLGGCGTVAITTITPTPTLSSAATPASAGSLTNSSTYSVRCVALTLDGYRRSTVAGGLPGVITFTTADGTTGQTYNAGCAKASAAATQVCAASLIINAYVTAVPGAVAYAWFWATGAGTGGEVLGAITTLPYYSITAAAGGTQTVLGASGQIPGNSSSVAYDTSLNTNSFDGILTMCGNVNYQPAYTTGTIVGSPTAPTPWTVLPNGTINGTTGVYVGTVLTADGQGGIVEIDNVLKWFWDTYRLSPTDIYVSSQEQTNISKKILVGPSAGTSSARFVFESQQGVLAGGYMVKSYMNRYSMAGAKDIPIHLHPNMPPGTILFYTDVLPYPLSNVSNVLQYRVLRDYYQIEWPLRTRRYEYGVYLHSVLQNYFPPAFSVLTGIANG